MSPLPRFSARHRLTRLLLKTVRRTLFTTLIVCPVTALASFEQGMNFYHQQLYTHALNNFLTAADEGDARAQLMTGRLYAEGKGGNEADPEAAHSWYQKAAEQKLPEAQYLLGMQYYSGTGVGLSQVKAFQWISKAARQNLTEAQQQLGLMYKQGSGTGTDLTKARFWLAKAARKGAPEAQYQLGLLSEDGDGAHQDYASAVKWHSQAASQGHAKAALAVAYLHYYGLGTATDLDLAAYWLQRAAEAGINVAQYNLAVLYEGYPKGKPNKTAALKWYKTACDNDYQRACQRYSNVRNRQQRALEDSLNTADNDPGETSSIN